VGTLLPVIGLAQGGYQSWADRFVYWPHIGLFIVIVWGVAELAEWAHIPARATASLSVLVLASLMVLSWIQVSYWESNMTIWQHTLDVTENNDRAHEHVAVALRRKGQIDEANRHLLEAVRIQRQRRGPQLH
jgi:protein O-mannosyl-transferase